MFCWIEGNLRLSVFFTVIR